MAERWAGIFSPLEANLSPLQSLALGRSLHPALNQEEDLKFNLHYEMKHVKHAFQIPFPI